VAARRKARDTWRRNGDDAAMACRAFFDRRSPPSPIVRRTIQGSPQAHLHKGAWDIERCFVRHWAHSRSRIAPLGLYRRVDPRRKALTSREAKFQRRCIAPGNSRIAPTVTALVGGRSSAVFLSVALRPPHCLEGPTSSFVARLRYRPGARRQRGPCRRLRANPVGC